MKCIWKGYVLSRKFGKNATIKVPCTPAGLKVCKKLSRDLVNVNVTSQYFQQHKQYLLQRQVLSMFHHFVGRVDDNSFNGIELIDQ